MSIVAESENPRKKQSIWRESDLVCSADEEDIATLLSLWTVRTIMITDDIIRKIIGK